MKPFVFEVWLCFCKKWALIGLSSKEVGLCYIGISASFLLLRSKHDRQHGEVKESFLNSTINLIVKISSLGKCIDTLGEEVDTLSLQQFCPCKMRLRLESFIVNGRRGKHDKFSRWRSLQNIGGRLGMYANNNKEALQLLLLTCSRIALWGM